MTVDEIEACADEYKQFQLLSAWHEARPALSGMSGDLLANTFTYMRYIEQLEAKEGQ